MNLNDSNFYFVVMFKRKIYYMPKERSMTMRDVFMRLTKDGVKPVSGVQEIFLLDFNSYEKLLKLGQIFKREEVRKLSSHVFSVRGYQNLIKKAV